MTEYNGVNMQEWVDYYNPPKCQCGADKAKLGEYGHSIWCPVYKAPVPINDLCQCGIGSWHSPGCKFRIWPEEPVDELKKIREKMKIIVDKLNNN